MFNAVVTDFNSIKIIMDDFKGLDKNNISIKNNERLIDILEIKENNEGLILTLKEALNIKSKCIVIINNLEVKAICREIFCSANFNNKYAANEALGCFYSKEKTSFKLWSPAAEKINLLLYKNGDIEIPESPIRYAMVEKDGLWSLTISEDLKGSFYTYEVKVYGRLNEAVDPYAKSLGVNGNRGAIINIEDTNPLGFEMDISPFIENFTDAIIYETSIRDISMHPESFVINKGKFLGLAEEHTRSRSNLTTALSHIIELGITHVQLMPIYDFSSLSTDEKNPIKYNWGYDPQNFNAPEGSYSTDPYNPYTRIHELKTLIQTLHKNGLGVIMDVVFNHVFNQKTENLEKIFPSYYFRMHEDGKPSDGSGCGNDTASERFMMRKFIIDSVYYWAKEYHLDGFRFDLMGLHDVTTMNAVREKLNTLNRPIMLYGEGWMLNTLLKDEFKANQENACKMPHIGHFNDTIRNSVRGSVFIKEEQGFISGKLGLEEKIKECTSGCIDYANTGKSLFNTPDQAINYVSAHDNNTLWDKLNFSNPGADEEALKAMQKLANAIVITSQGIPFIHSGAEFCRTKYGVEDSVRSVDKINSLDWDRKAKYLDVFNYYKGIINLRKSHPAFRMNNAEQIRKSLEFIANTPINTVGFMLKNHANNDDWKDILIIYNANKTTVNITIPEGSWNLVVDNVNAGTEIIRTINGSNVEVEKISMFVLYR
ncbi:type I pullulanase [Candidatus Clostridium radicumherbarum]|uniref:Type I pullulanase n=1 Tax=Candidatus Clostridium radicumherbarum TaxID=3381662 RepID=A0ABW8TV00_9CLOT